MAQDPNLEKPSPQLDRLTRQLYALPSIVGRMGLSIAAAQKEMNLDYVNNVARLIGMIKQALGDDPVSSDVIKELITSLAPPRYQFTQTTIDFSADLSESRDVSAQAGLSVATKAVSVNAAMALAYGYDYRAAARVTCVIHAHQPGVNLAKELLARSGAIVKEALDLPKEHEADKELREAVTGIYKALTSPEPPAQ